VPPTIRLASKAQLWVLNGSGLISLRDESDLDAALSVADADAAIKRSMTREEENDG
jgi:hypothetical protein